MVAAILYKVGFYFKTLKCNSQHVIFCTSLSTSLFFLCPSPPLGVVSHAFCMALEGASQQRNANDLDADIRGSRNKLPRNKLPITGGFHINEEVEGFPWTQTWKPSKICPILGIAGECWGICGFPRTSMLRCCWSFFCFLDLEA